MKNNFETNVLNRLLDKYENSKLSKGGTQIRREIKLDLKDDVFSTYTGFDSYKYSELNDTIIKKLESLGFVNAIFYQDSFKSLTLNLDNIDKVYLYLKRTKPSDELEAIRLVLSKYKFNNFVDEFIEYISNYLDTKYSYPKSYFDDSKELDLILYTFNCLFKLNENMKKRDFSVTYLHDSKAFEQIEGKIIKIIKEFDYNTYQDDEDVLASYNIIKNSSYALVKNNLIIRINNQVINLNDLGFEVSLSDDMIKSLEIIDMTSSKVITVENLTSFYSLNEEDSTIIYLAGFHNHTKQMLLEKIYNKYPNIDYYHFSDIDVGGFLIYNNLKDKTQIPFKPYKMGLDEIIQNKDNLKSLTKNDKLRLEKLRNDLRFNEFFLVIDYMLEHNVKLEQEILD